MKFSTLQKKQNVYQTKLNNLVLASVNKKRKPIKTIEKLQAKVASFNPLMQTALQREAMQNAIKEINKNIKKTIKAENKQVKGINKLIKTIKKAGGQVPKHVPDKKVLITFSLYYMRDITKRRYINHVIEFDADGGEYVRFLVHQVPILQSTINHYQIDRFYNVHDDDVEIIRDFIILISNASEEVNKMLKPIISGDIDGFKISNLVPYNENYQQPDFINIEYRDDAENKAIHSKYTKYIANLNANKLKDLINFQYNEYVQKNFRPKCCLLTAIVNKYYNKFNKVKSDGKRAYKELTYDYLCEILEVKNQPNNIGVSIKTVVEKFFKRFSFAGLSVYSPFMKLIYRHDPQDITNSIVLKIMVHGSHVYELNDNTKTIDQIDTEADERKDLYVSDKYSIQTPQEKTKTYFLDNQKDLFEKIKHHCKEKDVETVKFVSNIEMNTILMELVDAGYHPSASFHTFLYRLSIKLEGILFIIEWCDCNSTYGKMISFSSLQEYEAYQDAYQTCYSEIIKPEYISDYHPSVSEVHDTYKISPVMGYIGEYSPLPINGLDERKAYTQCLQLINKVPVFHYFDVYQPYDNHTVEDYTYYIIEIDRESPASTILFGSKYCRTYGFTLKLANTNNIKYLIKQFRRPFKIEEVNYKQAIDTLYNKPIDTDFKKMIVNKVTGLLEQKKNSRQMTKVFKDFNEAKYYEIQYEGKLLPLMCTTQDDMKQEYSPIDGEMVMSSSSSNETLLYLVNISNTKQLSNGLCPIKDIIYCMQKVKLFNNYNKLVSLKLKVMGIKTDCIFYQGDDKIVMNNFDMSDKIGNYKIEVNKYINDKPIIMENNELIKFTDYTTVETKEFQDEKNTADINKYIKDNKVILIKGLYPGVGKSTACKKFDDDAFFILPYNKLCQNIRTDGYDAITYCRAFGLFKDDKEMKNIKSYDLSEHNTIIFDEALLYTPDRLKRLARLINDNPDKVFIATGDTEQRNPIGFNDSKYLEHCMNVMFRHQILFKDIKRLSNDEDKLRWKALKHDIFNTTLSVEELCKKHKLNTVDRINDVKTTKNVAYFNHRCDSVNSHVHTRLLKKTIAFAAGQEIICRHYLKYKGQTLNTNYTYRIRAMTKTSVFIIDEVDEIEYTILPSLLTKHFKLPHCSTCDSIQGLSFGEDEKVTIFDSNLPYTDKKFLWTAITRARKLDNITIYIHPQSEVERYTESKLKQYFKFKVDSYKQQDRKANREFKDEDYITADWIYQQYDVKDCPYCKKAMTIHVDDEGNVTSNITVNRHKNTLAHTKKNCELCCHHCNITLK